MDREYSSALEGLRFNDDAKQRMTCNLIAKATSEQPVAASKKTVPERHATQRPTFAHRFAIAAAIAGALILGTGGIAVASGNAMSLIAAVDDLFQGAPAPTEIVDTVGRPVGATVTSNGLTVTADAVIGDRENYLMVFSLSKTDGTSFDAEANDTGALNLAFETSNVHIAGVTGANGYVYFYDSDPNDNAVQFVVAQSAQSLFGSIIGGSAHVSLSNLVRHDGDPKNPTSIAEGSWNLDFKIAYEDASLDLSSGQAFDLNGMNATIDSVTVSPIAVSLDYTAQGKFESGDTPSGRMSEELEQRFANFLEIPVTVAMKDGSTLEYLNTGGMMEAKGDAESCHVNIMFGRILDLAEVSSITIEGVEIHLP